MSLIQALVLSLLVLSGHAAAGEADAPAPQLTSDSAIANAGFYQLSWSTAAQSAQNFELQASRSADFSSAELLYSGPDHARSFSGQRDGAYHYRVRIAAPGAAWSEPVQVVVAHHPLARAWLFFALGALVFLATLMLILFTPGRTVSEEPPDP